MKPTESMSLFVAILFGSVLFGSVLFIAVIPSLISSSKKNTDALVPIPVSEVVEDQQHIIDEPETKQTPNGRWVWALVTAYCPCSKCCGNDANNVTSIGVKVNSGNPDDAYGIAADPKAVPYGTRIYVPGYWESLRNNKTFKPTKMTTVDDTGGAMRQSWKDGTIHLDVRYRTHSAAIKWGRRHMRVFIYTE